MMDSDMIINEIKKYDLSFVGIKNLCLLNKRFFDNFYNRYCDLKSFVDLFKYTNMTNDQIEYEYYLLKKNNLHYVIDNESLYFVFECFIICLRAMPASLDAWSDKFFRTQNNCCYIIGTEEYTNTLLSNNIFVNTENYTIADLIIKNALYLNGIFANINSIKNKYDEGNLPSTDDVNMLKNIVTVQGAKGPVTKMETKWLKYLIKTIDLYFGRHDNLALSFIMEGINNALKIFCRASKNFSTEHNTIINTI